MHIRTSFLEAIDDLAILGALFELSAVSRDAIGHLDNAFPRSHIHAVFDLKPVHWLRGSRQLEHLLSGSIALHLKLFAVLVHWIKE